MFATTDAAASLVDHCRVVTRRVKIDGLREKLAECFGDDGLHNFVIQLRILLHHIQFVEASWKIHYVFSEGAKTSTFEISKDPLLQAIAWSFKGGERRELEDFVTRQEGEIDLKLLLLDYGARVKRFYEWFDAQITSVDLTDYDRVMFEKKKAGARNSWKIILMFALNMKVPVNPHNHLHKHLPAEDIAEINKLPRNSREQADFIISLIDRDNAINDQLRDMAYQLFERAEAALQDSPSPLPSCPLPASGAA